ncbi:MinD-like ATPase involved in chromosome partitioning or flagellar assembly [Microbacterium natoriense]|uniref:MinD-like ATPase involved in chromosome partitioning or flagellar assembly n=1 Tax=Microbacterium natoriense TaxID=284570 RepID=A0AAW8EX18_9MICO|nr:P-loop NTPase [Microbacterium natoriense]MDQ0647812.1 MinD-like ATPase involved in chromosome partitioning or flagellar assembly [Microbacterium natoriense]
MMRVLLALPEPRSAALAAELDLEDVEVVAVVPEGAVLPLRSGIDVVVVTASRAVLTPALVDACDRAGVRIVPLGDGDPRLIARYGLSEPLPESARGWEVAAALLADAPRTNQPGSPPPHRITAVWGPPGAPGRSTLSIQLAVELARTGRRTALVDADTVAPSIALLLGLSDDDPGIAAACRRAELGALDPDELTRLATAVDTSGGSIDVLGGINRPSRWPELSASRLSAALQACRGWAEETVVDVSAAFDADDEATYDLTGPRRHAATAAALAEADTIVAVASADPLGISRFLRDHAELRRLTGPTPVVVVVNQLRAGPLGLDARGQIRRTLERFGGIADVVFVPFDQRAADAALLHARPIADVVPRSPLVAGVRRLAARLSPTASATADSSRGSSRAARRLRPARAVQGA